ncbi:hypothetical protein K466DRAFT_494308 [Polyporus arcularius HHB13444]|uniref:DUF6533 domain-containing protein n=1 Tax=Polyporus arcularius HHB13444 TaxID=1314778 RepID=A0A5C3P8S5_9APHY|nr:hypothetical protein K466DRAFT_494308 [Polyporus arcularius HHB13444]
MLTLVSALCVYEAFVTFDREVACFWTAKRTGASLLFFANRWISLTVYVLGLVQLASLSSDKTMSSCRLLVLVTTAMQILQSIPGAVFSALRAYVLCRSKVLGLLVLALSLAPAGANLVTYGYRLTGEKFPPFGCLGTDNTTPVLDLRNHTVVIISRVPLIVADCLLIYITWTKLSGRTALKDIRQSRRLSFSDILLRDGTIYFIVLFILNVLHLVFSVTSHNPHQPFSITTILVSRFLLQLQEANQVVVRLDPDDPLHSSRDPYDDTPSFISSLGAFISADVPAPSEDEFELRNGSRSDGEEEGGPR